MDATFEYGGATLRVRRPTVRDNLTMQAVRWVLNSRYSDDALPSVLESFIDGQFTKFLVLTDVVDGAIDWQWPAPTAPLDEMLAGLEAWGSQPEVFLARWQDASERATMPPNDPDLQAITDPKGAAMRVSPNDAPASPNNSTTG